MDSIRILDDPNPATLKQGGHRATVYVDADLDMYYNPDGTPRKLGVAGSGGDVSGPGSSTDNAIVRFDGTDGKHIQNSPHLIGDDGKLTINGQYFSPLVNHGNSGTTETLDFSAGNEHIVTLDNNCTLTFSNPTDGGRYILLLKQDSTGSRIVTWPASVRWNGGTAPTLTTTAGTVDLITFMFVNSLSIYIAAYNLNYTP